MLYCAEVKVFFEEDLDNLAAGKSERFLNNIAAIRATCEARGIFFILATQQAKSLHVPSAGIDGITYQEKVPLVRSKLSNGISRRALTFLVHAELMENVRRWAVQEEVPLADIIGVLDQRRSALASYVHLTSTGNKVVAQELANIILGWYPDRPRMRQ